MKYFACTSDNHFNGLSQKPSSRECTKSNIPVQLCFPVLSSTIQLKETSASLPWPILDSQSREVEIDIEEDRHYYRIATWKMYNRIVSSRKSRYDMHSKNRCSILEQPQNIIRNAPNKCGMYSKKHYSEHKIVPEGHTQNIIDIDHDIIDDHEGNFCSSAKVINYKLEEEIIINHYSKISDERCHENECMFELTL
mmetsp:Transcript_25051/g.28872  ORF Transcript_25051/g.28872 Transcript_25051/m.28872 type:complete len:195 (-) Transcript_25051:258-842(-)